MPCSRCGARTPKTGRYSRRCRACCEDRTGWCYLLHFPGTGVCKVGHTTDLARRLRSYTPDTVVAWSRRGPLPACRLSERRIKRETRALRAPDAPWAFAANAGRQRRGRPAFSGHTELRAAATPSDLERIRARYEAIFESLLGR